MNRPRSCRAAVVVASPQARSREWNSAATTIAPMQLESAAALAFVVRHHEGMAAVVEQRDAEGWVTTPVGLGGTVAGGADFDGDGRTELAVLVVGELTVWFSAPGDSGRVRMSAESRSASASGSTREPCRARAAGDVVERDRSVSAPPLTQQP